MSNFLGTPLAVVWALARETLANRDRMAESGWLMPEMPHESEVRRLLKGVPSAATVHTPECTSLWDDPGHSWDCDCGAGDTGEARRE